MKKSILRLLLLVVTMCLLFLVPLQASRTGNQVLANRLFAEMTEVEVIFYFCSEFHLMLEPAKEEQKRAYNWRGTDEDETRRRIEQLEDQFEAYLKNMAQERWCLPYEEQE
jgi:hypothetical protein